MTFPLVTGQSNQQEFALPLPPKEEELKKETEIAKNALHGASLELPSPNVKKVSKRPVMNLRFTKPFKNDLEEQKPQEQKPNHFENSPICLKVERPDEEIKAGENALKNAMIRAYPKIEIKTSITSLERFDQTFESKGRKILVNDGQAIFEKGDFAILSEKVDSSLAIGVICYDTQGQVVARGLGNFSEEEVMDFIRPSENLSKIRFLLDSAKATTRRFSVFLCGMYKSDYITGLDQEIRGRYGRIDVLHLINPWKIPQISNRTDKEQLNEYIRFGFSLKMGMTTDGKVLVADVSNNEKGILTYRELDFERWKVRSRFKTEADFNVYQARLISLATEIYKNRNVYSKPNQGVESLKKFCAEKEISIEDLFINQEACEIFFKSDNLRRVLYSYVDGKLTANLKSDYLEKFRLYEEIKNKILKRSVIKTINQLNTKLPGTDKEILYVVKTIFPASCPEFLEMEEVKPWLLTKSGKITKDVISKLYGGAI